ncbi:MAG TPA: hypothetical protein VFW94_12395 [Candidatus Acidoferrales bacterium]|nr:hypothetical protein [Candidatus Acidoferrales bacterium]
MKSTFGVVAIVATGLVVGGVSRSGITARRASMSAPTYYMAISGKVVDEHHLQFRGASDLPVGARISVAATTFSGFGWMDQSTSVCVPVDQRGGFVGLIGSYPNRAFWEGTKYGDTLLLRADFQTRLCGPQPANVLRALGKKGEGLANVAGGDVTELVGLSDNPQLYQVSGWYYGIQTIARVE